MAPVLGDRVYWDELRAGVGRNRLRWGFFAIAKDEFWHPQTMAHLVYLGF